MSGFLPQSKAEIIYREIAHYSMECADRFRIHYLNSIFTDTTESEIVLINRFWRLQLARLNVPTYEERMCLADNGDFNLWLVQFRRYILPTIIEHRLPWPEV